MSSVKIAGYNCPFCNHVLVNSKIASNDFVEFWICPKCRKERKPMWHWYYGHGNGAQRTEQKHWEVHKHKTEEFGDVKSVFEDWLICDKTNTPIVRDLFVLS